MKIKIYTVLLMAVVMAGCNDWLDVNPRQEMKERNLYSSEDGFKNSLTGVYIQLANANLFGRNTSMYLPEMLAHHYTIPAENSDATYAARNRALGKYNYEDRDAESMIETVWKSYYKSIVQLNNILTALEENEVYFTAHNEELIKGEALGLRAFLHFEVLRYFGDVPSKAIAGNKAIPYATQMTKDANLLVSKTWAEVLQHIEKDLNEAEALLKASDPILEYTNNRLNNPGSTAKGPEDEWHFYRQNRFNYYAVLGAKARFYQWTGNKGKASDYAKMVIDAKNKDNDETSKFRLHTENDFSPIISASLVFPSEHLFSVHNPQHRDVVDFLFKERDAIFKQNKNYMANAYETGLNPDDIRFQDRRYWEEKSYPSMDPVNHFFKYTGNEIGNAPGNLIPIIRLSEMYFIMVENQPLEEAKKYFETYRIARSLGSYMDESLTDQNTIKERLEKEYRKEFFGEGQMFFFYKRLNYTSFSWPITFTLPDNAYKLPIPKSQSIFE